MNHRASRDRTAFVLAGGAARGAYEVGVLEHVLVEVARDLGHAIPIDILSGTSVGALNACGLAAHAAEPAGARVARMIEVWTSLEVERLVRPDVRGILGIGGFLLGRGKKDEAPRRDGGVLDPTELEHVVERSIPFERIGEHIRKGHLEALTVSATHIATGRTVVFVEQASGRGIDWSSDPTTVGVATDIGPRHALASAAIPILFRAVRIGSEWYCDGGLRQNVPLSPARRLGADRILVVNPRHQVTTPLDEGSEEGDDAFPGPLFLLGKTLSSLLLDRIDTDLARLSSINRILEAGQKVAGPGFVDALNRELGHAPGQGLRPLRALLVRASEDIGQLAAEFVRSPSFQVGGMTGRLMRAMAEPGTRSESDLLSYLLFDGRFAAELIDLGRRDAKRRHEELCAFFAGLGSAAEGAGAHCADVDADRDALSPDESSAGADP